jgi:hypothetical protein
MKNDLSSISTEINGWIFNEKASQSGNPPLLMLFHGWTGDENVM